jgi:hypothetical protein
LKSVSEMPYIATDADVEALLADRNGGHQVMHEDFAMTIEIFYLTAQIQRWLNARVARHLAEQAERLAR